MQRRRFKQTSSLNQRLIEEVQRLRKKEGAHPGIERDKLIRKARHAEAAADLQEWFTSPGLRPPD